MRELIGHLPYRNLLKKEIEMIRAIEKGLDPLPDKDPSWLSERVLLGKVPFEKVRPMAKILDLVHHIDGEIWRLGYETGYLDPIKEVSKEIAPLVLELASALLDEITFKLRETGSIGDMR